MRPSFRARIKRGRRPVRPLPSENGWIFSKVACVLARRPILSVVSALIWLHQFSTISGIFIKFVKVYKVLSIFGFDLIRRFVL